MSPAVIVWHPTPERFAQIARTTQGCELFLATDDPAGMPEVPRVSLLVREQSIKYGLLRIMQRNKWTLMICLDSTEIALEPQPALERAIELAEKFRIDVDFLLTLPSESLGAVDATKIFAFLKTNRIRRVSFAFPFLLSLMGLLPACPTRSTEFFRSFFDAWKGSDRTLVLDDAIRLSDRLEVRLVQAEDSAGVRFFEEHAVFADADGPVAELLEPRAADNSRECCARACEYFLVCGGDQYGAKSLFNGTLESSDNPYCSLVAKPHFERMLAQYAQ